MNIRVATLEDAPLLAELNVPAQQLHHDRKPHLFKPPTTDEGVILYFRQLLTDATSIVFIGEEHGKAIGYVYVQEVMRAETAMTYALHVLYVHHIALKPEQQRHGYGDALMHHVFEYARSKGITRLMLDVWAFNREALSFFTKEGFSTFNHQMDLYLESETHDHWL